jgi:predicted ATPase/DNA-binding winged helix-turn-helix (wHTH) protein
MAPNVLILADNLELDRSAYELRRAGKALRLSRIPMELLLLLVERRGELVTRNEIVERIWGKDVFLDTDNSINAAVRKLRQVLDDDPEQPRFVHTVTGMGYRFVASVTEGSTTTQRPAETLGSKSETTTVGPHSVASHYRIIEKLGGGGMGIVYKALDLRLERYVALKFLPDNLVNDLRALERFRREALAASALNHANICTVYDIGEQDGRPFLAMEFIEGATLHVHMNGASLPIEEILSLGIQIADALDAAHAESIIHRDIKPANIFVTKRGQAKVLEFGLAKLMNKNGRAKGAIESPHSSLEEPISIVGVISGTPSYMSPEQIRGDDLDARADVFSMGLLLYEMATGQKAFPGGTGGVIIEAILNRPPAAVRNVNPNIAVELEAIINKAIEKNKEQRYQSAAELRSDLQMLRRDLDSGHAALNEIDDEEQPGLKSTRLGGTGTTRSPDKHYVFTRGLAPELSAMPDGFPEKPLKQVEMRPSNLPVSRTGFVGREKEVAAAKELLLRQDVRVVTVTGPGGIGKTRLAVEVASGLVELFPGGIHFVPLSPLIDPSLVASVIVQALGIRETGGQSSLEILKKNFQDSLRAPILFLLDNFEHLLQAAPIVAELLAMSANLKILVTSRAALHVYGEHEFPVPPLALPDSRSAACVEVLSQYAAVALFIQRAVAAKPAFELNQENAAVVTEICARLDGLPLAIELAAARIKVLSPSSMLTRLASRLQLLTGGARDLPQRQQTLRAAMDWSYDLLSAAEQKLFRRLSVFVGGCNLEGVEAVCDTKGDLDLDRLDGMASMVDKSLAQQVEHANGESRFVMLETIREYALEKLEASGEKALTKRSHAAYCLVLAEEEAPEQSGGEGVEWLERFALEHDNFRAGLDWLTETGDAEWGLRLGTALFRFWEIREYLAEGRDRLARLLKLAGAAPPTKARMRALFAAGVLAGEQGDYTSAETLISESRDIAHHLGDRTGIAVSLNALAVFARDRGDVATAHTLFEKSLLLWRELGDQKAVARSLSNLANVVKLQGAYSFAHALYGECISIFRGLGDRTGVAWSLNYQGDVARDQGDCAASRALYEQGLAMFRELEDRWGIAGTLADLGSLAREQQNYPLARSLYRESIKIFWELGHKRGIARLLECFACSAAAQLDAERSLRLAGAAATLRKTIGAPLTPAEQAKLESALDPARQLLIGTAGTTAWLEGSRMPVERVIEEVLLPEAPSSSC